jgi:hypothetical protein
MQSPAGGETAAGFCCSDAEVTYSRFPRADPCLHANDVLSARSLTLEPKIVGRRTIAIILLPNWAARDGTGCCDDANESPRAPLLNPAALGPLRVARIAKRQANLCHVSEVP